MRSWSEHACRVSVCDGWRQAKSSKPGSVQSSSGHRHDHWTSARRRREQFAGRRFLSRSIAVIQSFNEGTARFDFNISPNQRLTLRSFVDTLVQPSEDIPGNILSVLNPSPWSEVFGERMEFYNEVLSHTWTISPTTVNTVSVFWTQMSAHNASAVKDSSGQNMCWSRYINVNELPGQCYMEGFSVA